MPKPTALPRRTKSISIKMTIPAGMSDTKAMQLFTDIIRVGEYDVAESADNPDLDNPDADLATSLRIGKPKFIKGV